MRKLPQQQRSRDLVERIVAAGRTILLEDGYDAVTTNRVAAKAGVSPGSLYQYFPDKATIIGEVIDRYSDDLAERVSASLTDRLGQVGPEMVRETVTALLDALAYDAPLLRVVVEELPLARHRERRQALERRIRDVTTGYLAGRPDLSPTPDHATTSWMLILSIENLVVRFVLDQPPIPRERFLDEMVALCVGYLQRPSALDRSK